MQYLPLIILLPLAKLVTDDFRRREVPVVWLVILAVGTIGVSLIMDGELEVLIRSGLNLLVIAYLGAGIAAWGWIKSRKLINPVNKYIGLGDILFFLALVPLFPVMRFAWLLVTCMVFSLVWWRVARRQKKSPKNIPLVATSGIVVGAAIILNTLFG